MTLLAWACAERAERHILLSHYKKYGPTIPVGFKTGTLCNAPRAGTLPTPFAMHLTTDKC